MMRSPEATTRLLALLGRGSAPDAASLDERAWGTLAEVAGWHGVLPLLRHRLHERGMWPLVPPAVRRSLATVSLLDALRAEARRQQLRELLEALRAHDVPVVPLKGAYLAEHAYPDAALRPMADVDLLVPGARLDAAHAALAALGYAPDVGAGPAYDGHRHSAPLLRAGRLPVELHHTIEPCAPPFTRSLDDVWARTRPAPVAGTWTLVLEPEDLLLHLATHMGRSHLLGWSLVSVYDVAMCVARFGGTLDWEALARRAADCGARRFVYAALALARLALAAEVPSAVLRLLRTADDEVAVGHALQVLGSPPELLFGARAVTNPRETAWTRVQRVARALLVSPIIRRRLAAPGARRPKELPGYGGYTERWTAAARMLLSPSSRRTARRQVAHVRALRAWAARDDATHGDGAGITRESSGTVAKRAHEIGVRAC